MSRNSHMNFELACGAKIGSRLGLKLGGIVFPILTRYTWFLVANSLSSVSTRPMCFFNQLNPLLQRIHFPFLLLVKCGCVWKNKFSLQAKGRFSPTVVCVDFCLSCRVQLAYFYFSIHPIILLLFHTVHVCQHIFFASKHFARVSRSFFTNSTVSLMTFFQCFQSHKSSQLVDSQMCGCSPDSMDIFLCREKVEWIIYS